MHTRFRAFVGALVVSASLVAIAGSGASGAATNGLDLSSTEAIESYLQSIGVDPATVTWQRGALNYAGPNCPGPDWNCTTATSVVQISQAGGENRFECEPEEDQVLPGDPEGPPFTDPDANVCVIAQAGDTNHARCSLRDTEEPLAVQVCKIGQEGVRNFARIDEVIIQDDGPNQEARQTAEVDQHAVERNQSHIDQSIVQRTSTGEEQVQDGFQLADVNQVATGSDNFSHVHQSQDQRESGSAEVQLQNTNAVPAPEFNCGPEKSVHPNQCADVDQDTATAPDGGKNESHLHQAIGEQQSSTFEGVVQTQGRFDGGQEGNVHQENPPDVGHNHDVAHQDLRQRQSSSTGVAFQQQATDPSCCGIGSQIGAEINREFIKQRTTQSASDPGASQFAELFGQVHQVGGGGGDGPSVTQLEEPNNRCRIDHHGRNNSGAAHFSASGEGLECANLVLSTTCVSAGDDGDGGGVDVAQDETPACFPSDGNGGPVPEVLSFPTTATFGLPIEMPSFGEPDDYLAAISGG